MDDQCVDGVACKKTVHDLQKDVNSILQRLEQGGRRFTQIIESLEGLRKSAESRDMMGREDVRSIRELVERKHKALDDITNDLAGLLAATQQVKGGTKVLRVIGWMLGVVVAAWGAWVATKS